MRNCYFGLALLLFFLLSLFGKKNKLQIFFLVIGMGFAILSTGGIFKTLAYKFIPFVGYIRLNGEFSIFAILCFIIIAAIELDKFIQQKKDFNGTVKWIYYLLEAIIILTILIGFYKAVTNKESFFYSLHTVTSKSGISLKLKAIIDALSFYDSLWIQGIIQLILLWGIKWCLKFKSWNLLKKIVVADMILACLLNLPFTGVGKASVAQVQSVLNKSPKGIPIPNLAPINYNDTLSIEERSLVGDWSFYNKQIGTKAEVLYPILLKNTYDYFEKNENYLNRPFIFVPDSSTAKLSIQSFSPQKITVTALSKASSQLVLQQNYYPHWYYINGTEKKEVNKFGINFMYVPIIKGQNNISFVFDPAGVKKAMLLSAVVFIICCLLLFFKKKNFW